MEMTPKQQAAEQLRTAETVLIVTHKHPDGDALGSVIALKLALEKLGKEVTAIAELPISENLKFLPSHSSLGTKIKPANEATITIDLKSTALESLGYRQDEQDKKLYIVLQLKDGVLQPTDVVLEPSGSKYDAIVVLDSPDLDRLGDFYEQNAKLFYEIPVVNIDHHPGNDHFGRINWVDMTATSTCELLVALLESLGGDGKLIDDNIATALLTGIITDTGSFQNTNTTPKSLTVAAQLVAAGGRREEIIQSLYRTRSLGSLKLWGKILSNIKHERNYRLVWSFVTLQDIESSGAGADGIGSIIDELLKSVSDADLVVLFDEREDNILHGSLRSINPSVDVSEIAKTLGGGGHDKAAAFERKFDATLTESISNTLITIRDSQKKRLELVESSADQLITNEDR